MRNSMSVEKYTWKPSMLVLIMVLIHGYCHGLLNYVAEVSRGWDESNKGKVGKTKSQPNAFNAKAGMYTLNEDIDMKAKVATMTRRLEELELKKIHEVQVVAETPVQVKPCPICQSYEHLVEECPKIPTAREMFGEQANVRDVKALITLRSGKKVELSTPKPHVEKKEEEEIEREEIKGKMKDSSEGKEDHDSIVKATPEKVLIKGDVMKKHTPPHFPQFCMEKRESEMHQKFLNYDWRNCSGKSFVRLGSKCEFATILFYKQLGLGELKPTSITLSLVDRSVKIPRGIIEDVLVQVDNFYYPVDFVVLDTDPIVKENYVPIILGRPFLATSNAIINSNHSEEEEGPEEVCIIDTLVEEHCNQKMQDKLNESLGDLEEGLLNPQRLAALQGWRRRKRFYLVQ
ncbi:hypothetical protein CK203_102205 [Vitis vinifera]|uniref:Uncharacterized protein n=1 Tax=Vitis vinifera TaxID=29760 RepID=A0A438DFG8_VITVI|nr:hypothetical protein CK203_102205 [Vitis vinifera]